MIGQLRWEIPWKLREKKIKEGVGQRSRKICTERKIFLNLAKVFCKSIYICA